MNEIDIEEMIRDYKVKNTPEFVKRIIDDVNNELKNVYLGADIDERKACIGIQEGQSVEDFAKENWTTYEDLDETIREEIKEELSEKYDRNFKYLENIVAEEVAKHSDLSYEVKNSNSWDSRIYPSVYLIISGNKGNSITIRFCDGHENGRQAPDFLERFDIEISEKERKEIVSEIADLSEED